MGETAIDPAISGLLYGLNHHKPQQTGNPHISRIDNITDPNFKKSNGHLDEENPSTRVDFAGKKYNQREPDITIPAYDTERDGFRDSEIVSVDSKPANKECY